MDVCHYTFVQTLECILGVNSKVNNELRVIILCQCKFTSCNKGATRGRGVVVRMLIMGEAVCVSGGRGHEGNRCTFSLSFAVNLKLLLKIVLKKGNITGE